MYLMVTASKRFALFFKTKFVFKPSRFIFAEKGDRNFFPKKVSS
jgi:hypothetical protein